jgi:hypothetical protein
LENSKFLKIVWGINGVLILLAAIVGIFMLSFYIYYEIGEKRYEYNKGVIVDESKKEMKKLGFDVQHLLYDTPESIPFTDFYFSQVYVLDKEIPDKVLETIKRANDISRDWFGGTINIIFFNKRTEEVYTLINEFGFITTVDIPRPYSYSKENHNDIRNYNLYRIALEDTNGDGRINRKDKSAYYISDLSGKHLKRITPDGIDFYDYWIDRDNKNLIFFEEVTSELSKDQYGLNLKTRVLYTYNVETDEFYKFQKFQDLFDSLKMQFNKE